jgi:hypothetical protein
MFVGVSQGGATWSRDSEVRQLPFATRQTIADLAQRLRPSQLAKKHGDKLTPTGKSPGMPLGPDFLNPALKLQTRKKLEKLTENAAKCVHG